MLNEATAAWIVVLLWLVNIGCFIRWVITSFTVVQRAPINERQRLQASMLTAAGLAAGTVPGVITRLLAANDVPGTDWRYTGSLAAGVLVVALLTHLVIRTYRRWGVLRDRNELS